MANTIAHLAVAKELINQTEQYGGGAIVICRELRSGSFCMLRQRT